MRYYCTADLPAWQPLQGGASLQGVHRCGQACCFLCQGNQQRELQRLWGLHTVRVSYPYCPFAADDTPSGSPQGCAVAAQMPAGEMLIRHIYAAGCLKPLELCSISVNAKPSPAVCFED